MRPLGLGTAFSVAAPTASSAPPTKASPRIPARSEIRSLVRTDWPLNQVDSNALVGGSIFPGAANASEGEDAFTTVAGVDAVAAEVDGACTPLDAAACPAVLMVLITAGDSVPVAVLAAEDAVAFPAAATDPPAVVDLGAVGEDDVLAPEPKVFAIAATPVGPLGLAGAAVVATPDAAFATLLPVATDGLVELDDDAAAPTALVATLASDILSSKYHLLKITSLLAGVRKNAVLFLRRNYRGADDIVVTPYARIQFAKS